MLVYIFANLLKSTILCGFSKFGTLIQHCISIRSIHISAEFYILRKSRKYVQHGNIYVYKKHTLAGCRLCRCRQVGRTTHLLSRCVEGAPQKSPGSGGSTQSVQYPQPTSAFLTDKSCLKARSPNENIDFDNT